MTPKPCSASTSLVGRLAVILAERSCVSVIRIRKIATTVALNPGFWHSWVRRYDALSREQTDILARRPVTVGNTGVTKRSVVERGALQRDEVLEGGIRVPIQALRCAECCDMRQVIRLTSLTENPRVVVRIRPWAPFSP